MLKIETLVGMTEKMLADEDFIETFASHGSKVNRRNRIKEYAAEAGTPVPAEEAAAKPTVPPTHWGR